VEGHLHQRAHDGRVIRRWLMKLVEIYGISSNNDGYQGMLVVSLTVWLSNVGDFFSPMGLPIVGH